ncbi:hypothetical protein ACA910_006676 [Epithemia clementina (nom. ined.)]
MMLVEHEKRLARSRCWTLTICFGLLIVALLCGPLVLSMNADGNSDNKISTPFELPSHSKLRKDSGCDDSNNNATRSQAILGFFRRLGCPRHRHQDEKPHQESFSLTASLPPETSPQVPREQQQPSEQKQVYNQATVGDVDTVPAPSYAKSRSNTVHVASVSPAFPSYLDFEGLPINVTYDAQSIRLNNQGVVLLGGSMHPTRAAWRGQWERALDEAVHNGLNLITLYVFWSAHQPFAHHPLDWSLPYSQVLLQQQSDENQQQQQQQQQVHRKAEHEEKPVHVCQWELADAIKSCADRGLFVHIRFGPYTCAEYSYGGIPEWIGVEYPDIRLRRMDPTWLHLMEDYVQKATEYVTKHGLWAHQGGPIIFAQIENELGTEDSGFMQDQQGSKAAGSGKSEIEEYADWCGDLVQRVAPSSVVWTMCNGVSARNTIDTFNGFNTGVQWLERHGDSGRIQVDRPALWTEDEQGFQDWGEAPGQPLDYIWGVSARDVAKNVLRWIARGGFHVNYYMWWGGYNRGRTAAAGILNAYATDAVLCPSGERRQPKFGHMTALHQVIASVSPLLAASEALPRAQAATVYDEASGTWSQAKEQLAFTYSTNSQDSIIKEVIFLENNADETVVVRIPNVTNTALDEKEFTLKPYSAVILVNGNVAFASDTIAPEASAFSRTTWTEEDNDLGVSLLDWQSWREPVISLSTSHDCQQVESRPVEQTKLLHRENKTLGVWSDYAWYSSTFTLAEGPMDRVTLVIDAEKASAFVVYLDGEYQGSTDNHQHAEGLIRLEVPLLYNLSIGRQYDLTILSESLGYHNLIGRWGGGVGAKQKGLLGDVALVSHDNKTISLVSGSDAMQSTWCSVPGLQGERIGLMRKEKDDDDVVWDKVTRLSPYGSNQDGPLWKKGYFDTPLVGVNQRLFLQLTSGRGHVWLNGHDLGRFWNITRMDSSNNDQRKENDDDETRPNYSQRYYHLPVDLLRTGGSLNELVIVNVLANGNPTADPDDARLVFSWIETSSHQQHQFEDTIGFEESCLL